MFNLFGFFKVSHLNEIDSRGLINLVDEIRRRLEPMAGKPQEYDKSMTERFWVRLTPEEKQKLTEVMPGDLPGTIDPREARKFLSLFAGEALAVKKGEKTPQAAADVMLVYFDALKHQAKP